MKRSWGWTMSAAWAALLLVAMAGCTIKVPQDVLYKRAQMAESKGQLTLAEDYLNRAMQQNNADWRAHFHLGHLQMIEGRPLAGQLLFEKALALRPGDEETPMILDALAESLYQQDKQAQLASMLAQACRDYDTTRDFLRQAHYLAKIGDRDGAAVALGKAAMVAKPDDASPYVAAYRFYDAIGDGGQAVRALRNAYYFLPQDPEIAMGLRRYGIVPGPTVGVAPPELKDKLPPTPVEDEGRRRGRSIAPRFR